MLKQFGKALSNKLACHSLLDPSLETLSFMQNLKLLTTNPTIIASMPLLKGTKVPFYLKLKSLSTNKASSIVPIRSRESPMIMKLKNQRRS